MDSVISPTIAQHTQEVAVGGGAAIGVLIDRFGKYGVLVDSEHLRCGLSSDQGSGQALLTEPYSGA